MGNISQQTLREFVSQPFGIDQGQKTLDYETRYQNFKKHNKIKVESTMVFNDSFFIHLKVPSESNRGDVTYDVVIQFFTENEDVKKELHLKNYYVQFFSNSPGFAYKYAALYREKGYLIETLQDKFGKGALDKLPEKANSKFELYYDSTIYYACRYFLDNKLRLEGKLNFRIFKTKRPEFFFGEIQDFDSVNIDRDMSNIKKRLEQELKSDSALAKARATDDIHRKAKKNSAQSTLKNNEGAIKKIIAKQSTMGAATVNRVSKVKKKTARRSTTRKS